MKRNSTMASITSISLSLLLFNSQLTLAQGDKVETMDKARQERTVCLNPEYLVHRAGSSDKPVPLLIYLHGAGGGGTEINKMRGQIKRATTGVSKFKKGPCIIVAPQCLRTAKDKSRATWKPKDLDVLLEDICAKFKIDTSRVYVTGNSMGGYGSFAWGAHSPEKLAAVSPVVGGIGEGGPKDVTPHLEQWAKNLAKVPVYAYAGAKDKVVPAEYSVRIVNMIKKAGGKNAQVKVLEDQGHGAGKIVFNSKEYFDWIFSQKRSAK